MARRVGYWGTYKRPRHRTIDIPPEMDSKIRKYAREHGLDTWSAAVRVLIGVGLAIPPAGIVKPRASRTDPLT